MKIYRSEFGDTSFRTYYITEVEDAKKALAKINTGNLIGLDIETSKLPAYKEHPQAGLCPKLSKIRLVQMYDGTSVYVFDLLHIPLSTLKDVLKNSRFVAHNAIFELGFFIHNGFPNLNIGCSMLLSQLLEGAEYSPHEPEEIPGQEEDDDKEQTGMSRYKRRGHNLDAVMQRLLGVKVDKYQQTSDWSKKELSADQITYAALDAVLTHRIAKIMVTSLIKYKMEKVYKLLKDMQHVIAVMQLEGLPVDWKYHEKLIAGWNKKSNEALYNCQPFFGTVNMQSSKQMGEWLPKYLKDDPISLAAWPRTKSGAYAFGKSVIGTMSHLPAIAALLDFKKYAKLIDTYGDSLTEKIHPVTTRLHTSYTLGETRTGRLSSRNPNCQNYPRDKDFRDMFCAETDHVLVVSDFSQIELRLQAEFSKDPVMCETYKNGEDIYCTMATSMYGRKITKQNKVERFVGKTVMLALGYGMGPNKLALYAANAGINQPAEFWQKAHKTYHTTFRTYSLWCDKMRERAKKLGYIDTLMGKRRRLAEDDTYTRAPNTVIQGSAAELMMLAMLICHKRIQEQKINGSIVATVHDEILLHVHKKHAEQSKTILEESMNDAMKEMFPHAASLHVADAAYGSRWGEVKAEL